MINLGKKKEKNQKSKYQDVLSHSAPRGFKNKWAHFKKYQLRPFLFRNNKRNMKLAVVLGVFVAVFATLAVSGGIYMYSKVGLIDFDDGFNFDNSHITFEEEIDDKELEDFQKQYDVDASTLKGILQQWATNGGEKLTSKNVINVLLLGENDGLSDTMMLVSLNKSTKTITLTSFMRDSYTYMNIDGDIRYDKLNHSYSWGGPLTLIETIENNYKITIDHYVSIDFKSFVKVIDLLGGVEVPITSAEARYMNRTTRHNDFTSGDTVLLDGTHALVYARIRKLDSEVERTRRQRCLIESLIRKTKSASLSQLDNMLDEILPYISTNYRSSEIVSLGTQALTQGWMNFKITKSVEPNDNLCTGVYISTWSYPSLFVWVVDYPISARNLQTSLYGTTNIVIDENNHKSALDMVVSKSPVGYTTSSGTTTEYYNPGYEGEQSDGTTESSTYPQWENDTTTETTRHTIGWPSWLTSTTTEYSNDTTSEDWGGEDTTTDSFFDSTIPSRPVPTTPSTTDSTTAYNPDLQEQY